MKKKIAIIVTVISFILAVGLGTWILKQIPSRRFECTFMVKAIEPTVFRLFATYQSGTESKTDTIFQPLAANQFFLPLHVSVPNPEHLVRLQIEWDEQPGNTLYFESLIVKSFQGSTGDTTFHWRCDQPASQWIQADPMHLIRDQTNSYLELVLQKNANRVSLQPEIWKGKNLTTFISPGVKYIMVSLLVVLFFFLAFRSEQNQKSRFRIDFNLKEAKLLVPFFFLFLFLVFLNSMLHILPDMENKENRKLNDLPKLKRTNFYSYTDEFTRYASEQFAFRNLFYFLNSWIHTRILQTSSQPDKVILGKQKWLFYNDIGSMDDFRRLTAIDSNLAQYMLSSWQLKMDWLKRRNIHCYILIPPNKERIYPDYMPEVWGPLNGKGHNSLDYLKKWFAEKGNIHFIDPSENLLVARRKREVYYKNDTHWNTYGGFIAYQDLMKRIAQDFHQIKPFAESDFTILPAQNHEGDLAAMMGLNRVNPRDEFVMQFKDHKYQLNFDIPTQMILKYHNTLPDTTSLKLIMFRDSFGSYLIPFLNNHFKETVFVWNYIFMNRLIDVEKPDIVVFESLQRFLIYSFLIANPHAIQS